MLSTHPHNGVKIALQFYRMKRAKWDMEIILIVFLKKSLWQFGPFGPKMVRSHNFGSALSFFLILYNKRGQEVHEIVLVFFREKISFGTALSFEANVLLFDRAWSKLSQAIVTIGPLNSQDVISFMISTGSLNSQDSISQVNTWWILYRYYVMFMCGGQYSTEGPYGFVKKLP